MKQTTNRAQLLSSKVIMYSGFVALAIGIKLRERNIYGTKILQNITKSRIETPYECEEMIYCPLKFSDVHFSIYILVRHCLGDFYVI